MASRGRKTIFNILRITLCVGALWIVAQGVTLEDRATPVGGGPELVGTTTDQGFVVELESGEHRVIDASEIATDEHGAPQIAYGLKTAWRQSAKGYLLVALLMQIPVVLLQAWRFQWMLGVQKILIDYRSCLKLSYAGNFLNFATPLGSNAGDVFKGIFLSMHTDQKTEAYTTIALDRLVGLGSLILVVAVITTFSASDSRLADLRPYVLTFAGVGVVAAAAYLSPAARKVLVPRTWLSRLGIFHHIQRIDNAATTLARHKGTLLWCVFLTVLLQGIAMAAFFAVAIALALDAHAGNALEFATYFYTGTLIQALPGPPQGLGTVELAYRYFFAPFGSASQIVCMALAIRLVVLTGSLPGLLVTLTGAYKPTDAARDRLAGDTPPPEAPRHEGSTAPAPSTTTVR